MINTVPETSSDIEGQINIASTTLIEAIDTIIQNQTSNSQTKILTSDTVSISVSVINNINNYNLSDNNLLALALADSTI